MSLSIIVAISNNNCIGNNNQLLWRIPADMKFFKEKTMGHTVIMGKNTFESIGKPLPNRKNIVISRDVTHTVEGCDVFHSVEEVSTLYKDTEEEVFVIGGGEIYKQFLPVAKKLYVTHVDADVAGDTFFPKIDETVWKEIESTSMDINEETRYPLDFAVYERIPEAITPSH